MDWIQLTQGRPNGGHFEHTNDLSGLHKGSFFLV
jgi:hypothetical protein